MSKTTAEFRQGFIDILPILAAAGVIGLLWGTQAASKGLSPLEAGLMSATVFAGASQIIAIELWRDPGAVVLSDRHRFHRQCPPCADGRVAVAPYGRDPAGLAGAASLHDGG
jgi:hypothetical protein